MESKTKMEEVHNPLFDRKEIRMKITVDTPPKKDEAIKMIADKFSVPEENIHLEKVEEKFGTKNFTLIADIYNSKEEKENVNKINKKKKAAKAK